jgi:hypothetical protein
VPLASICEKANVAVKTTANVNTCLNRLFISCIILSVKIKDTCAS